MPENSVVVLKHKDSKVPSWVVPVPVGVDSAEIVAAWSPLGWSEDKKTDPADVPPAAQTPALPVTNS